jgi:predicted RNA-binding Zn-ribbon protein involved in translation (DUF1610 family)
MCVIAIKPEGVDLPTEEHLKEMFDANKDGAGFMYVRDKHVKIRKGFMTLENLVNGLKASNLTKEDVVVYHFRISTSGGISPATTHPFPLTDDYRVMKGLSVDTEVGIAHNGIISTFGKGDVSDTMAFIKEILATDVVKKNLFDGGVISLIEMALGSFNKMIFLHKDKTFALLGDWFKKNGMMYSNMIWEARTTSNWYESWKNKQGNTSYTFPDNKGLSKRAKKQLKRAGFTEESPGRWVKKSATSGKEIIVYNQNMSDYDDDDEDDVADAHMKDITRDIDTNIVKVPSGSTECPACGEYIFMKDTNCRKCGVFLEREDYRDAVIN